MGRIQAFLDVTRDVSACHGGQVREESEGDVARISFEHNARHEMIWSGVGGSAAGSEGG